LCSEIAFILQSPNDGVTSEHKRASRRKFVERFFLAHKVNGIRADEGRGFGEDEDFHVGAQIQYPHPTKSWVRICTVD